MSIITPCCVFGLLPWGSSGSPKGGVPFLMGQQQRPGADGPQRDRGGCAVRVISRGLLRESPHGPADAPDLARSLEEHRPRLVAIGGRRLNEGYRRLAPLPQGLRPPCFQFLPLVVPTRDG